MRPVAISPPQSELRTRLVVAVLFAGTWLLFSRALGAGFLDYDDPDFVTANVHVRGGLTWAGVRWAFTSGGGYAANWQPLAWLSLMLDRTLFGDAAWGFHATSITLHALNAVLAFAALRRLTGAFWTSAAAAALFAWHPLRVESVAWISERKDVLSVGFGLLSLWAYAVYAMRRRDDAGGAGKFYALALVAFVCGLLSKAMLVTLPGLLLLLDAWPLGRWRAGAVRTLLWEKVPFFLGAAASGVVTYTVQDAGGAVSHAFSFDARLGNVVVSVARYLGKFFWPFDLVVCYPHPGTWPAAAVAGAALLVLALTLLAWRQHRDRPWMLTGWLWFLAALVPVIGLVQSGVQAMADRYLYLPVIGVELALLWTLRAAWGPQRAPGLPVALAAVVLTGCAARTWDQLASWRDSRTLFEHALAVSDDNHLAHCFFASTLLNEGQPAEAARHAQRAIALNPDYAPAHLGLGIALEKLGRFADARASYQRALRLRPAYAPAHYRLGSLLLHHGEPAAALTEFEEAGRLQPDLPAAQFGLALAQERLGHAPDALAAVNRTLELQPDYAAAHNTCANLLVVLHRSAEAWPHYERALQLEPAFAEVHANYANSLREAGRAEAACAQYRQAIALQPRDAEAWFGLGVALEQLGRADDAIVAYREALARDDTHVEAHYNLGVLLLNRDEAAHAHAQFADATRLRPTFAPAWLGLGLAAEQLGDTTAAIACEERAATLDDASAQTHFALGCVLDSAGRTAEAARQWERALQLDAALPGVRERLAQVRPNGK